ncbi:MAG: general stress protein [Isosphaeraceae bacterium]
MATIVGLMENREQVERAVDGLKRIGVHDDQIGLVMRDPREAVDLADGLNLEPDNATGIGALGGGLLGGLGGLLAGAGALAIPGIGPALALGPILSGMLGGALGAATGGLIGTLVNEGVPEEEAKHYHAGIERGGILMTVHSPDEREDEVRAVLTLAGLRGIEEHRQRWDADPLFDYRTSDRTFIDPTRKAPI